jgi:hypothetical protein
LRNAIKVIAEPARTDWATGRFCFKNPPFDCENGF